MMSSSKPKSKIRPALEKTKALPAQVRADVLRGLTTRRTNGGIPVTRFHYSAIPARDPELHPDWKKKERATYTSQGAWDREQEIVDNAGGGELVFADTLITYRHKIIITQPNSHAAHLRRPRRHADLLRRALHARPGNLAARPGTQAHGGHP
jgi:hypothetical protein